MDPITTLATAAGLSWASGIRLYAVLFAAGALHALGLVELPAGLRLLAHPVLLTTCGILLVVEFLVDKVPGMDTIWDAVHTFIRVPAGALLAIGVFGQSDWAQVLAAALLGGTLAGTSHLSKASARALINSSPEPISNWTASFSEDMLVPFALWLTFAYPLLLLSLLLVFLALAVWLLPRLLRTLSGLARRLYALLTGERAPGARPR